MNNGTSFERPYIPDQHKRIVGPIEYDLDESTLLDAIKKSAAIMVFLATVVCVVMIIIGKVM
jgi:hypothetical protein